MTMMWITLAIGVGALGGLLAGLGWRGRRIDDHPWCRKCRFDLVGSWPGSTVCPECGGDLTRQRAVGIGQRQRSRPKVVSGVVLLVVAAGSAAWWASQRASSINWSVLKTDAWLVQDLRSPKLERAEAALAELAKRDQSSSLANTNRARLLDFIYDSLIPELRTTQVEWPPIVERAWIDGLLSADRRTEYARSLCDHWLALNHEAILGIRRGEVVTFRYGYRARFGGRSMAMRFELRPVEVRLNDATFEVAPHVAEYRLQPGSSWGDGPLDWAIPVDCEPGTAALHLEWDITCLAGDDRERVATWRAVSDDTITILPSGPASVEFTRDDAVGAEIRNSVHFKLVGVRRLFDDDDRIAIVGKFETTTIHARAEVGLAYGDDRLRCEEVQFPDSIVFWGADADHHYLLGSGESALPALKVVLYARDSQFRNPQLREFNQMPPDDRPLWFGPPMSIEVPIQWFDSIDSDGIPEELRRGIKSALPEWEAARDRAKR